MPWVGRTGEKHAPAIAAYTRSDRIDVFAEWKGFQGTFLIMVEVVS